VVTAQNPAAAPTAPSANSVAASTGVAASTTAATAPTTAAATAEAAAPAPAAPSAPPPAWAIGEPVFVTGMKVYKRGAGGKLESFVDAAAAPYAWPIGHDVRPAQQSLGARGCVECHASGAPMFDSKVNTASVISGATVTHAMAEARMESTGALAAFAATYPLRWLLLLIGYASAAVLFIVLFARALQLVSRRTA
jgi:hypothetical protein